MSNKKFLTDYKSFVNRKKDKSGKHENQRSLQAMADDPEYQNEKDEKECKSKVCEALVYMYGGIEPLLEDLEAMKKWDAEYDKQLKGIARAGQSSRRMERLARKAFDITDPSTYEKHQKYNDRANKYMDIVDKRKEKAIHAGKMRAKETPTEIMIQRWKKYKEENPDKFKDD